MGKKKSKPKNFLLGEIRIRRYIDKDSQPIFTTSYVDANGEQLGYFEALGMLAFAKGIVDHEFWDATSTADWDDE